KVQTTERPKVKHLAQTRAEIARETAAQPRQLYVALQRFPPAETLPTLSAKRTGNLLGSLKSRAFDSVAPAHSALSRNATLRDWRPIQPPYNRMNAIFMFMVSSRQVLGIQFFNGDADEAVQLMIRRGGFLIAPSGTCFARLREDERYRRAVLAADLAIADSGLMVMLCHLLRRESLQ